MQIPAESLSATSVRDEVVTATEAVRLIRDGDSVVVEGFLGQGFAEELTLALEERFLQSGTPNDLTLVFTVAQGNRQGRGLDRLCYEGLLKRAVGGHWALAAELGKMAVGGLRPESMTQIRVLISRHLRGFRLHQEGVLDDRAGTFSKQRWGLARSGFCRLRRSMRSGSACCEASSPRLRPPRAPGVDRSTIMKLRTVAKQGALDALAASRPGVRQGGPDPELAEAKAEIARLSEALKEIGVRLMLAEGKERWG